MDDDSVLPKRSIRPMNEVIDDMERWLVQHGAPDKETAGRILECQSNPYFIGLVMEGNLSRSLGSMEDL